MCDPWPPETETKTGARLREKPSQSFNNKRSSCKEEDELGSSNHRASTRVRIIIGIRGLDIKAEGWILLLHPTTSMVAIGTAVVESRGARAILETTATMEAITTPTMVAVGTES